MHHSIKANKVATCNSIRLEEAAHKRKMNSTTTNMAPIPILSNLILTATKSLKIVMMIITTGERSNKKKNRPNIHLVRQVNIREKKNNRGRRSHHSVAMISRIKISKAAHNQRFKEVM